MMRRCKKFSIHFWKAEQWNFQKFFKQQYEKQNLILPYITFRSCFPPIHFTNHVFVTNSQRWFTNNHPFPYLIVSLKWKYQEKCSPTACGFEAFESDAAGSNNSWRVYSCQNFLFNQSTIHRIHSFSSFIHSVHSFIAFIHSSHSIHHKSKFKFHHLNKIQIILWGMIANFEIWDLSNKGVFINFFQLIR